MIKNNWLKCIKCGRKLSPKGTYEITIWIDNIFPDYGEGDTCCRAYFETELSGRIIHLYKYGKTAKIEKAQYSNNYVELVTLDLILDDGKTMKAPVKKDHLIDFLIR